MKKVMTLALLALLLVGCSHSNSSDSQKDNSSTSTSQSKSESKNKNDAFRTGKELVADGIHQVIEKEYYPGGEKNYDKSQLDAFLADKNTDLTTYEKGYDDSGYPSFIKVDGETSSTHSVDKNGIVGHEYKDGKDLGVYYKGDFKTLESSLYIFDTGKGEYTDDVRTVDIYDKEGKLLKTEGSSGFLQECTYDEEGRLYQQYTKQENQKEYTLTYTYDDYGNELTCKVDNPDFKAYAFEYKNSKTDKDGNRTYTELHTGTSDVEIIESTYENGQEKTVLTTSESGEIIQYIEFSYK